MELTIAILLILSPIILTLILYIFNVISHIGFNEDELQKQPLFWISITTPICTFFILGYYFWEYLPNQGTSTKDNIKFFINSSKIPLSFLSLAFPFGMLAVRMHQTTQVKHQIKAQESKNNFEGYFKHREYIEKTLEDRAKGYAHELNLKTKFASRPILNHNIYESIYGSWQEEELFKPDFDTLYLTLVMIDKALRNIDQLITIANSDSPLKNVHIQKCIDTQQIIEDFSSRMFFHSIENMTINTGPLKFKDESYNIQEFDLTRIINCLTLIINIVGDAIELIYFTLEDEEAEFLHEKEVDLQNTAIALKDDNDFSLFQKLAIKHIHKINKTPEAM